MTTPDDNREMPAGENASEPQRAEYQTPSGPEPSIWQTGWATLIIIGLNAAVFLLMALNGVNIMAPESKDLIDWGANFKPLTLDGEWWRLLTSCFLHIGILHLAINMYSLFSVGVLLENMLGRAQYVIAYLVCGLAGSAASLWWHEATVSAGASGAIFGMFGLFYGWVTTSHRISSEEKKAQLASAGTFLAFNLFMGLSGKIDNAAHLGGLAAGIIIGLLVSKWHGGGAWRPVLTGSAVSLALAAVLIGNSTSDVKAFEDKMKEFSTIEESVLRQWEQAQANADKQASAQMYEASAIEWAKATAIAKEVNGYKLPDNMHAFTVHLVDFCETRGVLLSLLQQAATNNSVGVQIAIDSVNSELEKVNAQMESLTK